MTLTAKIVTTCVIALGIYDLYAVSTGGVDSTISRYLQNAAFDAPLIPFVFGFICGHVFGYLTPECKVCRKNSASSGCPKPYTKDYSDEF